VGRHAIGTLARVGSTARRRAGLFGRWFPRRRPPNRTCDFHRIRLSMSTSGGSSHSCSLRWKWSTRPCASSTLGSGAPVFTGDLLPSNHAAYSLDPFALWTALPPSPVALLPRLLRVLRHAPAATADGAPAPTPRVRRAPPERFPRSPSTGRQGRRPALPRGHRRAAPRHAARPRPPDQQTSGRDGPEQQPGPSTPTAHSRQFRGWSQVSGLPPLVRSPYAFLPC